MQQAVHHVGEGLPRVLLQGDERVPVGREDARKNRGRRRFLLLSY